MPILYHYVHCPFCVRLRMAMGYLKTSYDSRVLPYHDEKTPIDLMGVKMLPIFKDGEVVMNESLEILQYLDKNNSLNYSHYSHNQEEVENWLAKLGSNVHSLAMPQWIWTQEFDNESREYFQTKKEKKRGPFKDLVKRRDEFINNLNSDLAKLEKELTPFYKSETFSVADILIASHLWGMFVVPEFQFSQKLYEYLMKIKEITSFIYHEDYWR